MKDFPTHRPEVVGTGFIVLDRVYADGAFIFEELGGSCGNVLLSLAMLRRHVAPLIVLGCDDIGGQLVEEFKRAGADTRFIGRRCDVESPIVAQDLDTYSGRHTFSFRCRETEAEYPRYHAIRDQEVAAAAGVIASCSVLYADRLSSSIIEVMRRARAAGACVFFEPSERHGSLFHEALEATSIVKYSSERLGSEIDRIVTESAALAIVTHGAAGLEIRSGDRWIQCDAVPAKRVADTSGSGDMVSVGLIDWILAGHRWRHALRVEDVVDGVVAGQHLAAANCEFAGARGLFRDKGPAFARSILQRHSA